MKKLARHLETGPEVPAQTRYQEAEEEAGHKVKEGVGLKEEARGELGVRDGQGVKGAVEPGPQEAEVKAETEPRLH